MKELRISANQNMVWWDGECYVAVDFVVSSARSRCSVCAFNGVDACRKVACFSISRCDGRRVVFVPEKDASTEHKRVNDHLRDRLLAHVPSPLPTPAALRATEWAPAFERLMRNRLVLGAVRYGRMGEPGKAQWDRPTDILRRIQLYQQTGNLEHLVDAANLCMLEFVEGDHPLRHFAAADGEGEHTRKK